MKLFFIVFAAILAAAAVIFAVIGAKARLDQWEKAKWVFVAEMNNETAATKAKCDSIMDQAQAYAITGNVAIVNQLTSVAVQESQKSLKRIRDIQQRVIVHVQNKPFWIPLTADEQHALADAKAAIAMPAQPTPDTSLSQLHEDTTTTPLAGYEPNESMKPDSEASEAERERRRKAQPRDAQQIEIRRARPVLGREIVTTPTPTKGGGR